MNLYGSPLYIYSKSQIEFNWKVFENSFGTHPHLICYAVKANSNLAVLNLLAKNGLLIIVSFQSLEDRIVKDFFNHKSGKRWRSSRHLPDLADLGPTTLKIITKKPLRPKDFEINNNPRSRSAKLRVAQKI